MQHVENVGQQIVVNLLRLTGVLGLYTGLSYSVFGKIICFSSKLLNLENKLYRILRKTLKALSWEKTCRAAGGFLIAIF